MTPSACGYLYGEAVSCGLPETSDLGKECIRQIEGKTSAGSDARTQALIEHQEASRLAEQAVHTRRSCRAVDDSLRSVVGYSTWSPPAQSGGFSVLGLLLIPLVIALYFLPGIVAHWRGHHNENAIVLLNTLLGWTGLGWIAALIWSTTNAPKGK